jgi:cysteine desulfurase
VNVVAYLDHAATSPLRPEVVDAMAAVHADGLGNPSGAHQLARAARRRLDEARDEVASLLGRAPGDIVFTSGGTEADNLAVLGLVAGSGVPGATALCGATEHHAVLDPVLALGGTTVPVDRGGAVDLDALRDQLVEAGTRAAVVSVMLANNETGVLADLAAVREVLAATGSPALLHTDAVAAARWVDLAAEAAPADLVSVSAHKLGGPVGVGALVVPAGAVLAPRQLGGGQERGRRSGTVDVAGAVGLAAALALAADEREAVVARVGTRRDRLEAALVEAVPGLVVTVGGPTRRTAGTAHVCIPGVDSEALLFLLDRDGVCASAASSCSSGAQQASHVLAAMGVEPALGRGALRLSLGPDTSDAEVDRAVTAVAAAVERLAVLA